MLERCLSLLISKANIEIPPVYILILFKRVSCTSTRAAATTSTTAAASAGCYKHLWAFLSAKSSAKKQIQNKIGKM